ncbi:IS3 family transposase [Streptomyces sp. NBC_00365]|uniref:IS3 family transposase n=1 Tax=Streptomyces sp. NBC_00365 TaxID=2975726 RepID=UPI00225585BC|nr:IS3 family transposase [Streptomyces sp. NBC_00365]MCX5096287.1 IS3 family transposase [Streptomyces sp. NBC_00365]MCX5096353.1 IS3 family transposase [Streptomyces sp. NBC_00365]MCX5097379.1 IS3 family transposase [Streptomyces sp. NBC_00365]
MGRKSPYPVEFRNDAVALYRAGGGKRTYAAVAADVGVTGETLRSWVRQADEVAGRGQVRGDEAAEDRDEELARLRAELGRLRKAEKGVGTRAGDPAPGGPVFRQGDEGMTGRWDFISAHRADFGVQRICRVLEVSRSGYYRWLAGAEARQARRAADDALVEEIREIHADHKGTYGVRRIHAELRGFGHTVNRKRVERLMRVNGVEGRHLRRRKRTTAPDRLAPPAPDLVNRVFHAGQLDEKWCGDITYVQVGGTWLYLACVLDICSRRVLGWSMATHMRTELVIDALKMAVATRGGSVAGVIFHADRGSQYTSGAFAQVCDRFGIRRSMGRVGSSYDNALAESFWQGLKRETMHQRLFTTISQARLELFQWLTYYNGRRRHSSLGYLSPVEFEQQHQTERRLTLAA